MSDWVRFPGASWHIVDPGPTWHRGRREGFVRTFCGFELPEADAREEPDAGDRSCESCFRYREYRQRRRAA